MSEAMDCANARRQLSGLLDGEKASLALESHLASCAACSRVLARGRSLGAALKALPQRRPGPSFDAAVLAALTPSSRFALPPRVLRLAAAGAAVYAIASAWAGTLLLDSMPGLSSLAARGGVLAGRAVADAHLALRLASFFAPSPRLGGEFLAAAVLASALFLTLSLPSQTHPRALGARP